MDAGERAPNATVVFGLADAPLGDLIEVALACSTSRDCDDQERIVGDWFWHLVAHPNGATPEVLRGSRQLLDRAPDPRAVS